MPSWSTQVLARDLIIEVDHPAAGKIREVGCPIKFPGMEVRTERAPYMGEQTREVLADLAGVGEWELDILREKGVIDWTIPPVPSVPPGEGPTSTS